MGSKRRWSGPPRWNRSRRPRPPYRDHWPPISVSGCRPTAPPRPLSPVPTQQENPMSTTTHATHLPALGTHQREEVGQQLQAMLVELVDLSLLGKQLHWTVVGPLFRPLHLQLDELVDSWRELSDTVAERAVAIGFLPDGQSGAVAAESQLHGVERGELEDQV